MRFESKWDCTPPTILLGLLLCPWIQGIFFWWDPTFSCQWLFSSLVLGRRAKTNLSSVQLLSHARFFAANLNSILKSRDITLLTKIHLFKAMVFPVVMYGYESWTIKKAKHWRTDSFELWCWRRLFRVPWKTRSNQSILKEINPEYLLEELMLKLKFQYFGHLMWRADSFEKTLILGESEGRGEKEVTEDKMVGWHHWLNGHEFEQAPEDGEGDGDGEGKPGMLQ